MYQLHEQRISLIFWDDRAQSFLSRKQLLNFMDILLV